MVSAPLLSSRAPASPAPHPPLGTHGRPPPRVRGHPALQAPLLMCGALGWQAVWSMEMAYASPLLLALGLSKAATAAVLLAGPLAGLVVQPSIGYLSDACTHPWGRRRPWLLAACLAASAGMLCLGFARPIASAFGSTAATGPAPRLAQVLAALGVFAVDFAVNAVMALDRALCVDMLPASQQASGANWAARLAGLGDVLGLQASHMDLPHIGFFSVLLATFGMGDDGDFVPGLTSLERQMACLCLLSSSALLFTHAVACYVAVEVPLPRPPHAPSRELLPDLPPLQLTLHLVQRTWHSLCHTLSRAASGVLDLILDLLHTVRLLPRPYQLIFATQFTSWIGWFPLLFYSTLWVANIWRLAHVPASSPSSSSPSAAHNVALAIRSAAPVVNEGTDTDAQAARYGAKALFYRAVVSLAVSVCAPIVVRATVRPVDGSEEDTTSVDQQDEGQADRSSWSMNWARWKRHLHLLEPIDLWLVSIVFLASLLAATFWPEESVSPQGATVLMAATGMPWAVVGWIPFTLIGTLIGNDRAVEAWEQEQASRVPPGPLARALDEAEGSGKAYACPSRDDGLSEAGSEWGEGHLTPGAATPSSNSRGAYHPLPRPSEEIADPEQHSLSASEPDNHLHHKAGTILGLLNIAIVVPQFLSSALSSLLFSIADRGTPKDDQSPLEQAAHDARAIGLTLRIGALCLLVAAWCAYRLASRCRIDLRPVE